MCGDQQRVDLVHHLRSGLGRRAPLCEEDPHRLDRAITRLWDRGVRSCEDSDRCLVGVEGVGLAATTAGLPVLSRDFDDGQPRRGQRACEASPVRPRSLHPDTDDITVRVEERDDLRVTATVGTELSVRDRSAHEIEDRDVMRVLVRVDPGDQLGAWWQRVGQRRVECHARH